MIDSNSLLARGVDVSVWPPRYDPHYLPDTSENAWLPEVEMAPTGDRDAIILAKLRAQVEYAWTSIAFYRDRWAAAAVSPSTLETLEDLRRFPVITKSDLRDAQRDHPPFGDYLGIDAAEVFHIHGTSGTTGKPTAFAIGRDDWARIGEAHARAMWGAGIRPSDSVMICSFFSLYVGSWGALAGCERIGARSFPFGAGLPGQTARAIEWALTVQPTVFYGTPSYAMRLAEVAADLRVDPRDLGFRILIFSGEPGAGIPATKALIEKTFGGSCIDMGTMAEMMPWMTSAECTERSGMHLYQDIVYTEVCDPETFDPVPFGGVGTPVYTHLERTSQPMIRLVSGDRAKWTDDPCACGRTYPRLPDGLHGRYDDMLVVKGVNVYPSAVEDILRQIDGFGGEFRIVVSREGSTDHIVIVVEHTDAGAAGHETTTAAITDAIANRIGVRPTIEIVEPSSLDRTEFKSQRVIDDRELFTSLARNGS
ncbi:MAG TPA: phenylacetate--CoA ligase family protein [Acidimicrobiia bacterium]|nr:phenylacetate--CoA ligase family protein [Acidimicrobiia bacterium]